MLEKKMHVSEPDHDFNQIRNITSNLKIRFGKSGIHIFNRFSGLNVLLDEIQVPSSLWAEAPRHVSIALTNACDLSCPYCFSPKNAASLDFERVAAWLDELDINGCFGIGFGGGEPTLYPQLTELCHYAAHYTKLGVTLTTHAHHFNNELAIALIGSVHFVRVSMDGTDATYEALRGCSFVDFRRCLECVRSVAPFGINYIVNSYTMPDLDNAIKVAAEEGAMEFLLLPEQPVFGNGGIDAQTAQTLRLWVNEYRGRIPLTVSEVGAEGLPTCNPLFEENGLSAYAHIDAAGILKRTSFENDGVAIGTSGIMHALHELRHGR